jgi:hypothetical protein
MSLYKEWLEAKEMERMATERRREIEDILASEHNLARDFEGTLNADTSEYKVKIVGRLTHKVDADKLQELARENGMESHIVTLFRWKPEVNLGLWKVQGEEVKRALGGAITVQAGRPSFTIEPKGEK